jgi:hypothetical protein
MIEVAKEKGPLFIKNSVNNVTAVCPRSDFLRGVEDWIAAAEAEKDPKKSIELKTGKMTVHVHRTFTFANEQDKATVHTGTDKDLEALADAFVYHATGYRRLDVPEDDFESAMKILVAKDSRLFVPFSSMFRIEEQLKKWGGFTIHDAQSALLPR